MLLASALTILGPRSGVAGAGAVGLGAIAERAGIVFGWVFAAHMVGAGVAAAVSGGLRASSGSYTSAWLLAGGLALAAAAASWLLPRRAEVAA